MAVDKIMLVGRNITNKYSEIATRESLKHLDLVVKSKAISCCEILPARTSIGFTHIILFHFHEISG